jgi:hypothetical protein
VKCVCANARASVLGVPGCARDLEGDVVARKQELARRRRAWRHGEARADSGRRGEARRSQREAGERRGRCWGGTWPASGRLWSGEVHGTWPAERRRQSSRGAEEGEELKEEDEDYYVILQKYRDLLVMS